MTRREALPRAALTGRAAGAQKPEVGEFASKVLDVAESIPPGRVMSYGDIAEYVGEGGPRQVGRVMALWGGGVPWWRVVHADGSLLAGHEREALRHYRSEGTPLRRSPDGTPGRLDMRKARWLGDASAT
jgi:alkylated DNA nucleotide flippase Atl1